MITTPGFAVHDIELGALSSILQSEAAATDAMATLTPAHFSNPINRILFNELAAMWEAGRKIDLLLFTHWLSQRRLLDAVGGPHGVTTVFTHIPSPINIKYYVGILDEERDNQLIAETCLEGAAAAALGTENVLPDTLSKLSNIPKRHSERTFRDALLDKLDRMESGEPDSDLIKTGLTLLDERSPLRKGDMPLIAGERKVGKSILALSIALNVARSGIPVLYFSLEDREPKVIDRIFAALTRIPLSSHHVKRMTQAELDRATHATTEMSTLPFRIRDDIFDLHAIIALTRQSVAQSTAGLVVIDYAQLVRSQSDSRREEVERVSRDLRLTAMELNIPIILLCQLNKDGETRETKALEMDATAMWRLDKTNDDDEENNKRLIVIPFQRNGESGATCPVAFLGHIARVENLATTHNPWLG